MTYLRQIQIAIDFIEDHLDEDIDVALVASEAGLSRWHFQRIFKALTSETVKTYIRSRRLARALDKLLTTDDRIIDIAIAAGYESQASFTRSFKQSFDMAPAAFRKLGDRSLFLKKVRIETDYLEHLQVNISHEPVIAEQPAMRVVGMRTTFFGVDSEKNNMAARLPVLWDAFIGRVAEIEGQIGDVAYGVISQTSDEGELLDYVAGVAVPESAPIPNGMVEVHVDASRHAKFTHRGDPSGLDNTVNYVYSSWLLQSGERHGPGPDLEFYGPDYEPGSANSVISYAIPLSPTQNSGTLVAGESAG